MIIDGADTRVNGIVVGISGWALVLFILAALAWLGILHVMLVIFFGILIGILLRSLADGVGRKTGMSSGWSLAVVVIALGGLLALGAWLAVPRLARQLTYVSQYLPESFVKLKAKLEPYPWALAVLRNVEEGGMSGDAP